MSFAYRLETLCILALTGGRKEASPSRPGEQRRRHGEAVRLRAGREIPI
jgi:hypothetical protein